MNQLKPLSTHVALVTGAGRGIGAAISRKLAELGAVVIMTGRSREPLEATAAPMSQAGSEIDIGPCDVQDLRSVEQLASHVEEKYGRIDILVNNAGIGVFGKPLHELAPGDWDSTLNTNLRGVYYMIRSFAPKMIAAAKPWLMQYGLMRAADRETAISQAFLAMLATVENPS